MEFGWIPGGIHVESGQTPGGIHVEFGWIRICMDPGEFGQNGQNLVRIWLESRSNLGGF